MWREREMREMGGGTHHSQTFTSPALFPSSCPFLFLYLFLARLQVLAPEGVHAVPEAALDEGVVHAEADEKREKKREK